MNKTPKQANNKSLKTLLTWIFSLLCLTVAELFLLAGVSLIPQSAIQKCTKESADYFIQKPVFYYTAKNDSASVIDHYADAILLNILYHFDSEHPISSSLKASYYYTDTHNENANLLTAVTSEVTPTYNYLRYWHGSTVLIRPLLTFLNIRQIYILFAVLLSILTVILLAMLFRQKCPACARAVLLALISVSFWYIPMSLEYIWCFLIMLIAGIGITLLYKKNNYVSGLFFLLIGNITAYFDFLTTETLTLLFPLSLLLILMYKNNQLCDVKAGFKIIILDSVSWGIGYLSAWLAKWSITSIALGRNIFTEALSSASVRVNGNTGNAHGAALSVSALLRNISCLFPFNFIKSRSYAYAIGFFLLLLVVYYLFRKNEKKNIMPRLLTALFIIPYLRYLTLANHSFLHYFFTYRAQFASIFCLYMIFCFGIDRNLVNKTFSKKSRFASGFRKSSG